MGFPHLDTWVFVSYQLGPLVAAIAAWTVLVFCIGLLVGLRPQPTRVIFIPAGEPEDFAAGAGRTTDQVGDSNPVARRDLPTEAP